MIDFDMTLIDHNMELKLHDVIGVTDGGKGGFKITFNDKNSELFYFNNEPHVPVFSLSTRNAATDPQYIDEILTNTKNMLVTNYDEIKNFDPNKGHDLTIKLSPKEKA